MPHAAIKPPRLLFFSPFFLVIVLSFAAGISCVSLLHPDREFLSCISALLICLILVFNKYSRGWPRIFCCFLLGVLFFLLGLQHYTSFIEAPAAPHHIYNLINNKQVVSIEGVLTRHPSVLQGAAGPETRIIMQAKTLYTTSELQSKTRSAHTTDGLIQLTLNGMLPNDLEPGDHFLVKARVSRIYTFSTPGSFNYKQHLANQAILVKGWIQSPENIVRLHPNHSSLFMSRLQTIRFMPERIRHSIAIFLNNSLQQPARGLYKAILIGDRTDVTSSVLENFTAAGCLHILAISGVHMGLLAVVITGFMTWLLKRSQWILLSNFSVRKFVAGLTLLPLLIYALIAGLNIPALRAFLMVAVLLLAILFDRPGNLPNHILVAALFILIWKPSAIFTASFQLSFAAVIAIALIYPLLYNILVRQHPSSLFTNLAQGTSSRFMTYTLQNNRKNHLLRWLLSGIALTTAATLGTLPLLIFHFNRFSLAAPMSNLLIEPLICFWALILGLFASLSIPLAPLLARGLFALGSLGLTIAEKICAFFASLPHTSLWLPTPSLLEICLFYVILVSAVIATYLNKRGRVICLGGALICLFALGSVLAVTSISKQVSKTASISILDVGHGSSLLLQLPHNKNILIDGGGAGNERFNIGERVIAPFLWKKRLHSLDAVIITHPHADHYNGLPFVLKRFRPKILWINNLQEYEKEYRHLLDLTDQLGIETKIARTGDILFQEGVVLLRCIAAGLPVQHTTETDKGSTLHKISNPNNMSLVLRLDVSDKSFLFPADIDAAMADILVARGEDITVDVLLAPHHGSSSSMSQDFIEMVAPDFIAISAGRNNPFNLPDKSFYDLRKKGIDVLTTGRDGTLTFTVEDNGIAASRYQVN
jgi:competence protein ComEC